jgi:beta-phosphoglucomutase-like phosphatase (HAD superfamily)
VHAIILDIDGTLIQSDLADADLYLAAVRAVLGPVRIRDSWESYIQVTDAGILEDICVDNGIAMAGTILDEVKLSFLDALARRISTQGPFLEIPGARNFVRSLRESNQHAIAYATGGWAASASLKLGSAGFPLDIPLASSDDFPNRAAIMTHALKQMGQEFQSVTYYGDGIWDREATLMLGWRFVPVGEALNGLSVYEVDRLTFV